MRKKIQNILDNKGKIEDVFKVLGQYHIQSMTPDIQYGSHVGYILHVHYGKGLVVTLEMDKQGFLKDYV